MALDLSGLKKAIHSLDEAIQYSNKLPAHIDKNIVRDSVIQRFEYTYELAWKMNALKFVFSNSNLPILVDVVDWHSISDEFREKIQEDCVDIT